MKEIIVTYQSGERDGKAIDYMASIGGDLYAEEEVSSDRLTAEGEFLPGMEDESRERLKAEIIRQAERAGVDPESIRWN